MGTTKLTSKKIDDYTVEITKTVVIETKSETTSKTSTNKFTRNYIEKQIADITRQRDEFVALRNIEISECKSYLFEMDMLGIILNTEENGENI